MPAVTKRTSFFKHVMALLGWSRSSSILLGGFFLLCGLIVYIWWPLAQEALAYINWEGQWWHYMDWLLLGIFLFMSLTIMAHANLRRDFLIVFVGMLGGLVIESWGTQTNLWHYYTAERPPLWIIPAWPIASLSIDRISRLLDWAINRMKTKNIKENRGKNLEATHFCSLGVVPGVFRILYWFVFISFLGLMLYFVAPSFGKSFTFMALLLVALLIFTPINHRYAVLTFIAGAGLGYYLELWGTTRQCWMYYTSQTPPFFAVLAHGMAAVAFWRAGLIVKLVWDKLAVPILRKIRLESIVDTSAER
jgi:hypothetical protein